MLGSLQLFRTLPALAESDGYYCVGPGYLAYQVRRVLTGNVRAHTLRVVRFGSDGIRLAGDVVIKDFQPHEMVCGGESVHIAGFSTRPVEYVIDVTSPEGPRVARVARGVSNPQWAVQRAELRSLGARAPNGTFAIASKDTLHQFFLVTSETEKRVGDKLLHRKRTNMAMTDLKGNVVQRLELFDGHRVETID